MENRLITDVDGTLGKSVAKDAIRECLRSTSIGQEDLMVAIKSPKEAAKIVDHSTLQKCENIFNEKVAGTKIFPETLEALEYASSRAQIIISSRAPVAALKELIRRNNLKIHKCFGRENGRKSSHVAESLESDDYDRVIFVGNEPDDFNADAVMPGTEVVKIAVNVVDPEKFPEDVHVYLGPLTKEILAKFI